MSLAVIAASGAPSAPNVCPVVIHRPINTSSGRYSGRGVGACATVPAATWCAALSISSSFRLGYTMHRSGLRCDPHREVGAMHVWAWPDARMFLAQSAIAGTTSFVTAHWAEGVRQRPAPTPQTAMGAWWAV